MTIEELKKLDKLARKIADPFGDGFPACRKLFEDYAKECGVSVHSLGAQYTAWKWNKK